MGKKSKRSKEELIAKRLARAQATAFVARPFADLPFEADLICLRELVPAATATARLTEEYGGHEVTITSLLPAAWQAWHRDDGEILAGMQVPVSSTDASRDVARGLLAAVDAEPGPSIEATTEIYTLSLHDALPIWSRTRAPACRPGSVRRHGARPARRRAGARQIGRAHV